MYNPVTYGGSQEIRDLVDWVQRELTAIQASFFNLDLIQLKETNVAPAKPRTGMLVLADGTNWDPGDGAGYYGYRNGAWHRLETTAGDLSGVTWDALA